MAVKGYTTKDIIQNYTGLTISSSLDTQFGAWIEGVEHYIDKYTGRNFKADADATPRLYDGDGEQDLLIDDCIEITKVEIGNDSYGGSFVEIPNTSADRYITYPENAGVKGSAISKLLLTSRYWPEGMQNNRVTAKWGYSADVPADITFAATVLVAGIYNNQSQGSSGQLKQERIGNYTVAYDTDNNKTLSDFERVKEILELYKKPRI